MSRPPTPPPLPPPPSPSPPQLYKFKIENREIKTTVITSSSDLPSSLTDFLSSLSSDRQFKRIVGLDIATSYTPSPTSTSTSPSLSSKVSLLKLCSGRRCLLIHLLHFTSLPSSLASFLDLPDISFIGLSIASSLAALRSDYGLPCRNSVDLSHLAATVKEKPYLTAFGLADLANEIGLLNVGVKPPSAALSDWGNPSLSSDQVKSATVDAFLCFHIGNMLLGGLSL